MKKKKFSDIQEKFLFILGGFVTAWVELAVYKLVTTLFFVCLCRREFPNEMSSFAHSRRK